MLSPQRNERQWKMNRKIKMAGGFVLAGLLSCTALFAAAKCMNGESPVPVTAESQVIDAKPAEKSSQVSKADGRTQSAAGKKRRRTRKVADKEGADAPVSAEKVRKPRTRRSRKQTMPTAGAAE